MAFTPGNSNGQMNSTTEVTVVASPAASTQRMVKKVTVQNRDTVSITLTLGFKDGANTRQICVVAVAAGRSFTWDSPEVLDTTSKSITAVLANTITTTQPDFVASWADNS